MALRKTLRVSKQMGDENHEVMKKPHQSSVFHSTTQRRALNEIGNVVRQPIVQARMCVEISKEKPKTGSTLPLRRSTRLSVAQQNQNQPKRVTQMDAKPKETPATGGASQTVATGVGASQARSKIRVMGLQSSLSGIPERSASSIGPTKRKSKLGTRAPRLTMKPPPVETPPEEREAARNLIRQSLAAERKRRFTMAVTTDIQQVLIAQNVGKAVCKPIAKKKGETEISPKDDIDLMNRRCFWMVANYSKQVYEYLQRLDRRMASKIEQQQLKSIKDTSRTKLIEWMATAYVQLQLLQETFQLSVSILDRYLLRVTNIKETKFELVAVTCISLAIKYEELLTTLVKELLSLSSRPYTMNEFVEMESEVIRALDFQVARPIPLVFLRRYNTAAKCDRTQHSYGKYLIDLAQLDTNLSRLPASTLASGAVFIGTALRTLKVDPEAWNPIMVHYTTLTFADIKPVVSQMAMLALPGGPQCKAFRWKYAAEVAYLLTDRAQNLLLGLHNLSSAEAAKGHN